MAGLEYDRQALLRRLITEAQRAAGEVTNEFFRVVDLEAPVEAGHLHETLGTGLNQADLPESNATVSSMLSKGSGDQEASSRGHGNTTVNEASVVVEISTTVGFVPRLNDGGTTVPGVDGSRGKKAGGASTTGQLYAPRTDVGTGFLMWEDSGGRQFARSVSWGPLGFFESARTAVETFATSVGLE